ncbi:hypothetical protein WMY93_002210 [Mugilogobius chulae]|uniref:Uncharacterized protein n=1 Tax=Mugilogobius chulae TaxID=88201 RepID=A0AAW0PW43_9GOBI
MSSDSPSAPPPNRSFSVDHTPRAPAAGDEVQTRPALAPSPVLLSWASLPQEPPSPRPASWRTSERT